MKLVIIGSGNVATVLGSRIQQAGHEILQVVSHNLAHARGLGARLNCEATNDFNNVHVGAEIYLVAISDAALPYIHKVLNLRHSLVLHTAGSVSISILKKISRRYGVLYPLQSLRSNLEEIPEIPLLIDGNNAESLAIVSDFAQSISPIVQRADDEQRLKLHVSAVITGNFTNHLYALAEEFCQKESVDFHILSPLIMETADRIRTQSPASLQTGPAIRNDRPTMSLHMKTLKKYPALKKIYRQLSASIQDFHRDHVA
jgi:predicted short-subunit dehydrogenase-like oxidoreductase (DUF2520 family)